MTKLLQHVIDQLRNIPTGDLDNVAREIAEILEDYPTTDELAAIADGLDPRAGEGKPDTKDACAGA